MRANDIDFISISPLVSYSNAVHHGEPQSGEAMQRTPNLGLLRRDFSCHDGVGKAYAVLMVSGRLLT